ncbi:MAG TPA: TGS domain-containing protein, partial [Candidatus Limnocylindrales bacterium]|nr:TGS domain-containing protein [Candidatus Limnocylindrales bacterium]
MSQTAQTSTITVTLPDGSKKEVPRGTTPLDIANLISPRLAEAALVAKIKQSAVSTQHSASNPSGEPGAQQSTNAADGAKAPASMHAQQSKDGWQFADLSKPLESDVELQLLTEKNSEALEVFRHSSAHVLATAVLELFPETKLGHGPATDSGFFYDFYRDKPFTPE